MRQGSCGCRRPAYASGRGRAGLPVPQRARVGCLALGRVPRGEEVGRAGVTEVDVDRLEPFAAQVPGERSRGGGVVAAVSRQPTMCGHLGLPTDGGVEPVAGLLGHADLRPGRGLAAAAAVDALRAVVLADALPLVLPAGVPGAAVPGWFRACRFGERFIPPFRLR